MTKARNHKWVFKSRFRRNAFGWRSQPAIQRVKEAVREIKKVARKNPVLGAEGAVAFLERVSPALERVDSSSGAIGTAVNKAIDELVPILVEAPVDAKQRCRWLDRLLEALQEDAIPYIELLSDRWGELCVTKEIASSQADDLIGITRMALSPNKELRGYFSGTSACLSALFRAERYAELIELVSGEVIWPYKRWMAMALAAQGQQAEAVRLAESSRRPWDGSLEVDRFCEDTLLSEGRIEEAYERYGLVANRAGTYLATFRAVVKRYPSKTPSTVLADLVETTPGEEGKWFAAAKSVGLYAEALALASQSPCDPRALTRAARDFCEQRPEFATGAGLLALHWLALGYGYEVTSADVRAAYEATMKAAARDGKTHEVKDQIREMIAASDLGDHSILEVLARELGIT